MEITSRQMPERICILETDPVADFDGSGSTSYPNGIAEYGWIFGDGSDVGYGETITHTYLADDGEYLVYLVVSDDEGHMDDDTLTVEVVNRAPYAYVYYPQIDELNVTFYIYYYDPGMDDLEITLEYGDGEEDSWTDSYYHWEMMNHTYDEGGTYTITLTVVDEDGASTTATLTVTVEGPDPPEETTQ